MSGPVNLQCLIEVYPAESTDVLRYQNYQIDDLFYDAKTFEFGSFQVQTYPRQQLELADDATTLWIQNNEVVRSWLHQYNGLRKAIVNLYHIEIGSSREPWFWNLQVSDCSPTDGYVVFNLRSPSSALRGPLSTLYFTAEQFPELPVYGAQL